MSRGSSNTARLLRNDGGRATTKPVMPTRMRLALHDTITTLLRNLAPIWLSLAFTVDRNDRPCVSTLLFPVTVYR